MNAQIHPATHIQYLCHYNDMKTLNCSFITVGVEYTYYYTRLSVIIMDSYTCINIPTVQIAVFYPTKELSF